MKYWSICDLTSLSIRVYILQTGGDRSDQEARSRDPRVWLWAGVDQERGQPAASQEADIGSWAGAFTYEKKREEPVASEKADIGCVLYREFRINPFQKPNLWRTGETTESQKQTPRPDTWASYYSRYRVADLVVELIRFEIWIRPAGKTRSWSDRLEKLDK